MTTARKEIAARREIPAPLSVEPGGAEFAHPEKSLAVASNSIKEPDLYYVCEDVNGVCMYRRQDVAVVVVKGDCTLIAPCRAARFPIPS